MADAAVVGIPGLQAARPEHHETVLVVDAWTVIECPDGRTWQIPRTGNPTLHIWGARKGDTNV